MLERKAEHYSIEASWSNTAAAPARAARIAWTAPVVGGDDLRHTGVNPHHVRGVRRAETRSGPRRTPRLKCCCVPFRLNSTKGRICSSYLASSPSVKARCHHAEFRSQREEALSITARLTGALLRAGILTRLCGGPRRFGVATSTAPAVQLGARSEHNGDKRTASAGAPSHTIGVRPAALASTAA